MAGDLSAAVVYSEGLNLIQKWRDGIKQVTLTLDLTLTLTLTLSPTLTLILPLILGVRVRVAAVVYSEGLGLIQKWRDGIKMVRVGVRVRVRVRVVTMER
jgi:uncharacterized membrane protein